MAGALMNGWGPKRSALAARGAAAWRALLVFLRRWDKDALERAEIDARKAERRLREAIDVLPEGVVFLDAEGRYILWNKKYAEIYHRSADLFAPGRKLADTLKIGVARGDYPDAIGREEDWIADRLALLKHPGVRHEQRVSDGRWLMIEERATSEGGVIGLRVDITEMKEQAQALRQALARAEAANQAKSRFLTNMGHELRTPLNGVLGMATVLERGRLDPEQREAIQTIMTSAAALDALLCDLLDFSQLESGGVQLEPEAFHLARAVQETAARFRQEAFAKGLGFTLELEEGAHHEVTGDAQRMKQVLSNLLSNAVKFTSQGGISLKASAAGHGEAGRWTFEVADTGVGFDPADADHLFRRFEQVDGSLTRRFNGVGLGLAICKQLVELMGGTIRAEGRPGRGATFTVELPLPFARPEAAPAATEPAGASPDGLRVLVAEDNPTNRKVVELMLRSVGAEVACVENGAEAVEAVRLGAYHLVLMDIQMPVMDGLAAIRQIRAEEAKAGSPRLPILVLSANVLPEHMAASQAAGADGHMGKPISGVDLIAAVSAAAHAGPADGLGAAGQETARRAV